MSVLLMVKEGEVKAVEFRRKKKKIEIRNFLKFRTEEGIPLNQQIPQKLSENGFKDKEIILVSTSPNMRTEIKTFPKMKKKDAGVVIEREVKKVAPEEEVEIRYVLIGEREEREKRVQDYLISFAPKKFVWDTVKFIDSMGYKPKAIIPAIQSILLGAEQLMSKKENYGFINISENMVSIVFLKKGLSFISYREFPVTINEGVLNSDELELIVVEINRTIQFFKQKNRGENIETILVSGTVPALDEIAVVLNENIYPEVELVSEERIKAEIKFPFSKDKEFHNIVGELFPLMGGVFVEGKKEFVNFVPKEYFEEKYFKSRVYGFSISFGIVAIILIASSFYIETIKKDGYEKLKEVKKSFSKMESRVYEIERIKAKRKEILNMLYELNLEKNSTKKLILFFNRLSLVKPKDLDISSLSLRKEDYGWSFEIKGIVDSGNYNLNSFIFEDFKEKLSQLEGVRIEDFTLNQKGKKVKTKALKIVDEKLMSKVEPQKELLNAPLEFNLKGKVRI